jgi:flagellar biosynthesis protein FlhG
MRIVLTGCKGGVGTTTLAINLATAAKQHFERVLLIDANTNRGDVGTMLRLQSQYDVDDVLAGDCCLQQAMVVGPAGIHVVPRFGDRRPSTSRLRTLDRYLSQIGSRFDIIFMDAGCSQCSAEILWLLADRGIVVSTPDAVAIVNTYALLKALSRENALPPIVNSVVNQAPDDALADDVHRRLTESCGRFLHRTLEPLGSLRFDEHLRDAAITGRPVATPQANVASSMAIDAMVQLIADERARVGRPLPLADANSVETTDRAATRTPAERQRRAAPMSTQDASKLFGNFTSTSQPPRSDNMPGAALR